MRTAVKICAILALAFLGMAACSALFSDASPEGDGAGPLIASTTPTVRPPITPTVDSPQKPAVDPRALAAAKEILSAYRDSPEVTITPERLVYIVKQDCSSRKLTGHGLSDDRLRREGFYPGGNRPPIGCLTNSQNAFGRINLYG